MKQDIRLGTFAGIEVGLNWSVVVILALFTWELAVYVFPSRAGHPNGADWFAGVVGGVVLLASVLAHEVSHALVSRHNGVRVRSITLFVFGGIAQLEGEAHTPDADFRIAAVGPATSLGLAVLFAAAQALAVAAGVHGLPVAVLAWLWEINLLLAIFNLVPGAPLDGGRILRSILWRRWGDRTRASVAAGHAGRVVAVVLISFGVVAFVSTGSVIGLWPALIGFFVYMAARGEEQLALVERAVAPLSVGQVMTSHPPVLPASATVEDAASCLWRHRVDAIAVTGEDGRPVGLVLARAVDTVPPETRSSAPITRVLVPVAQLAVAQADEHMDAVVERMASTGAPGAVVLDAAGQLVGIVTGSDIERAVALGVGAPGSRPDAR